jgi:peptide/nickel transport system substrate-binding protein
MKITAPLFGAIAMLVLASPAAAERAKDGNVNIIYWQALSIMNPYLAAGLKDLEAASLVLEPLARYDQYGDLVPYLAREIPTLENGGVSEDLKSITWTLKDDLVWSDGSAVTPGDVIFTWKYCTDPKMGCTRSRMFNDVENVVAVDERTVRVEFAAPKPFPYGPFVGFVAPIIQARQFADCTGEKAPECTEANFTPIGTGPFVVSEFRPNDAVSMVANEHYRDPGKPAFATVNLKGGGDAAAAARSVLETGEFDYAWNLQLAPDVLQNMQAAGKGKIVSGFGTFVERLMINFTNPHPELGDERSTARHPHPFLSDIAVRKALSMAINRDILVEIGYGDAGRKTCNIVPAPEIYRSTANDTCLKQDIGGAIALLEANGWAIGPDGVRAKNGVRLSILYQTSTNPVRQDFQALIKQWWDEIGVETELRNISGSVFFGGDPASPDTMMKFYADIEMYANSFDGADPESYLASWACDKAPKPENQWQGSNRPRYCGLEYDELIGELAKTGKLAERAALVKKMNDKLMQDYVMIPLVLRGKVSAHSNSLGGVVINPWDSELWNAADWHRD